MSADYHPSSLNDLLKVIDKERTNLESLITELTDSQKVEPGVESNWSIKDIMAHIAAWEKLAQDRINATITGNPLKYPVIHGGDFVDEFNRKVYDSNKDVPLNEIFTDFKKSHNVFLEQIKTLDDEILSQKLPFDWAGNLTVQVIISANTHWHYLEHSESIKSWIEK